VASITAGLSGFVTAVLTRGDAPDSPAQRGGEADLDDRAAVSGPNLNPTIPAAPAAPAASRMAVTTHASRGRRLMTCPMRDQMPRLVGSGEP
jgi:hypothetical protein